MNTQQAIAFFTQQSSKLTQSLAALGLGNNGETVISLQPKVDQAVKTAFSKREQLSSKLDTLTAKARQAEDKLSLAAGNQSIEQERLAELQRQQSELEITIKGLQDRKQILSANGDSKRAAIKAEIATIKANITKTEAEVGLVKKQIADGLALVASYDSLRQQAQTAQEQANYHNQYVQYWGVVGHVQYWGKTKDIYGWVTDTAQVNARDSFQAQANQFTQQATAIQGQVDSFKQSLPVLEGTKNSKTDQIWLYYQELDAKNNVLSFASTQSGNDLALLDLQLSQLQTDLTQLKNTDIPSQKTITDGTTQRVTQVQSELDQLKTQKVSAQKSLESFNQSNKELLTTDLSLDLLQDSITKSQANIASLQGKLATPNQSVSVINSLNLSLTNEQTKLGQLKQQYQLEALEVLAVNQDRLNSLKGQLAAESSVSGAVKETTIGGYVVLVSQFADQLTGLSDVWADSLKGNHQFTVEVSNLFDSNLTSFVGVKKFIEDNLATPYSDYVLNGIQLDEALAIQEASVKYRDVLAKTVDDLQENIELQRKSVKQVDELNQKIQHIQTLTKYERENNQLDVVNIKLLEVREYQRQLTDFTQGLTLLQQANQNIYANVDKKGAITRPQTSNKYLFTNPASWLDAQSQAQALGGNLVTINDIEEQQWINQTFGTRLRGFWLGLTDKDEEGNWKWISSEPVTYKNWYPGEPNNGGGNEDYALTWHGGSWNDANGDVIVGLVEINVQALKQKEVALSQTVEKTKSALSSATDSLLSALNSPVLQNYVNLSLKTKSDQTVNNVQTFINQTKSSLTPKLINELSAELLQKIGELESQNLHSLKSYVQEQLNIITRSGVNDQTIKNLELLRLEAAYLSSVYLKDPLKVQKYLQEEAENKRNPSFGTQIVAGTPFTYANGFTSQNVQWRKLGDVNGDGKDDIIAGGQNYVYVSLSNGDGTFGEAKVASTTFTGINGSILRTKLARDRAVRAKFVEIRVRFNQGKV